MQDQWVHCFTGIVDGRPVTLERYDDGAAQTLRVKTNDSSGLAHSEVMPEVTGVPTPADAATQIEAETPQELYEELLDNGFSPEGAAEITRHAGLP